MATNRIRWVRNLYGIHEPFTGLGLFQAGTTQAIKRGELLEKTAGGATQWIPMDSDYAMSADVAIADCELKSGDLAGYYPIVIPRPGDVFEYELAASGSSTVGTAVYWSNSEKVTVTAGTNIIGHICGFFNYPRQRFKSEDGSPDFGTTIRATTFAHITIKAAASFYAALQG